MRPFNTREVGLYLMWIAVLLVAAGILAWLVFYSPGHEPIQSNHNGAVVMLRLPDAGAAPYA